MCNWALIVIHTRFGEAGGKGLDIGRDWGLCPFGSKISPIGNEESSLEGGKVDMCFNIQLL